MRDEIVATETSSEAQGVGDEEQIHYYSIDGRGTDDCGSFERPYPKAQVDALQEGRAVDEFQKDDSRLGGKDLSSRVR